MNTLNNSDKEILKAVKHFIITDRNNIDSIYADGRYSIHGIHITTSMGFKNKNQIFSFLDVNNLLPELYDKIHIQKAKYPYDNRKDSEHYIVYATINTYEKYMLYEMSN